MWTSDGHSNVTADLLIQVNLIHCAVFSLSGAELLRGSETRSPLKTMSLDLMCQRRRVDGVVNSLYFLFFF